MTAVRGETGGRVDPETKEEKGEAPDHWRCMRKKAKLRKHLANGDYHTLGLAARRSPLSVPSERDLLLLLLLQLHHSLRAHNR